MGSFDLQTELDTTTAEERGTKLHDIGEYTFGVVSAKDEGESKNGSPTLALQVEFLDGAYRGHRLQRRVYYSNKTQGGIRFFWAQLRGLGLTEDYLVSTKQTRFDQIALLVENAQFHGKITHREYPEGSGVYQEEVSIGKPISNPNVDGTGPALTGQVQPPEQAAPRVFDDEDTPAQAVDGTATTDDPWGTSN
jgi:hypothetical protein